MDESRHYYCYDDKKREKHSATSLIWKMESRSFSENHQTKQFKD
ncbi:MAG: hypothetical protein ACOQNV_00880 [Mycoplasmoidaceae bacterium]